MSEVSQVARKAQETHTYWAYGGKVEIELRPVAAALIEEVNARIKDPKVPMYHDEDAGKDLPNPADPDYLEAVADARNRRGRAALDALIMFGIELKSGMPDDDEWLQKLRFLERRGGLSLESYDLNDKIELQFMFKRFIVADGGMLEKISNLSGVTEEMASAAEDAFRGN